MKTLGVKNVYIIGGENVVSKKIEEQLKNENINVDRIQGKNREATSIEIAKRLDDIIPVKEVSVVNGYKGLADAVSIAAISANENMPIILSGKDNISKEATEFIYSNAISKSYIVGGDGVVSKDLENKLPNTTRIAGSNRKETNAQVINTFFTGKEINNLYIAKDGAQSENQLIDALSVGSLAAKTNSPIMIVGSSLDKSQKDLVNNKSFKTITQVGGNGNESVFNDIKNIQNETITSKPSTPGQTPSVPEEKPSTPEQTPSVPVEKPSTPGQTPSVPVEKPSTPEQTPSTPVEKDPVYPETITLYSSREGKNNKGLGDTTYDQLKAYDWKVESDSVVSVYGGKVKFENLHGKNNEDAKLTIKSGDDKVVKAALNALTLMNGKESQYTTEQLGYIISSGSSTIKDGSRYIY